MQPTIRASNADGIRLGFSLVPAPRLNTFMSKGLSLPAALARSSRFSKPVACSTGSFITTMNNISTINSKVIKCRDASIHMYAKSCYPNIILSNYCKLYFNTSIM